MPSMTSSRSVPHLAFGFLAGVLAILVFHQGMIFILSQAGMIQGSAYATRPIPPWGVPAILNQMFWGGLWGLVYALVADRWPARGTPLLAGLLFGLLGPQLVAWFVVSPIKGQPIAAGFDPMRMLTGALIQGAFGIGVALFYELLSRRRGALA